MEMVRFKQKVNAKALLEKNFVIYKDYKMLLLLQQKQEMLYKHRGHNKHQIMLNIKTFKSLCIKAGAPALRNRILTDVHVNNYHWIFNKSACHYT